MGKSLVALVACLVAGVGIWFVVTSARSINSTLHHETDGALAVSSATTLEADLAIEATMDEAVTAPLEPNVQLSSSFIPSSLEDWQPMPKRTYDPTNRSIYVSSEGPNDGQGTKQQEPVSLARAIQIAAPGDVVTIQSGTYEGMIEFDSVNGTPDEPITFVAEGEVTIQRDVAEIVRVTNSSNLVIDGVIFDGLNGSTWGVLIGYAGKEPRQVHNANITLRNSVIRNVAGEAGLVVRQIEGFLAEGNLIENIFTRPITAQGHGEGIYVGCGGCKWENNLEKDIRLSQNKIVDVGAEGIEVKPGVRDVVVEDNLVLRSGYRQLYSNASGQVCCYGGGIAIHPVTASGPTDYDTNAVVRRNRVGEVSYHGYVAGAGNSTFEANLAWDTGVKHSKGINNTAVREPYISLKQFIGVFDEIALVDNHAFNIGTETDFTSEGNYGQPARDYPNLIAQEITRHSDSEAAFSAWLAAAYG